MAKKKTVKTHEELMEVMMSDFKGQVRAVNNAEIKGVGILTNEFIKDANYYAPMDKGILRSSAIINSIFRKGLAIWKTPYARRLFYGITFNFSKDSNPNARAMWGDEAERVHRKKYKRIFTKIFDKEWG